MVMHIALGECPSSDKGMRRIEHGRHDHRYSVDTFLPTATVSPSTVGCAVGGGQGATVGTCIAFTCLINSLFYIGVGR